MKHRSIGAVNCIIWACTILPVKPKENDGGIMAYEVKVFNPKNELMRVISMEELDARGDAMLLASAFSSNHKVTEEICDWATCNKKYWKTMKTQRYCTKECSNKAYKASARRFATKRKEKRKKAKQ